MHINPIQLLTANAAAGGEGPTELPRSLQVQRHRVPGCRLQPHHRERRYSGGDQRRRSRRGCFGIRCQARQPSLLLRIHESVGLARRSRGESAVKPGVVGQEAGPEPPVEERGGGGSGGFDRRLTRREEQVRYLFGDVARKADIEALKAQIEASNTRTENVRTEVESVRTEISKTSGALTKQIGDKQDSATKWTVGTGATAVAVIVALLKLLP